MDVTVVVATFGAFEWEQLAWNRAIPNAEQQGRVVSLHTPDARSLGDARNQAVRFHDPQGFICFLDADDELEPGFIDAMQAVPNVHTTDLLAPALRIVQDDPDVPVENLKDRDMRLMNPCPIGTLIHRSTFEAVGGFWDEPIWEDWAMFQRAWLLGSKIRFVDDAVYRSYWSPASRNHSKFNTRQQWRKIINANQKWIATQP